MRDRRPWHPVPAAGRTKPPSGKGCDDGSCARDGGEGCQGFAETEGAADRRTHDGATAEGTGGVLPVWSAVSRQACVMPVTNADTCLECAARGRHSDRDTEQAPLPQASPVEVIVDGTRQAKPKQWSRGERTQPTRPVSPTRYTLH